MPTRTERNLLLFTLAIAFFIRLIWAITRPSTESDLANLPDQVEYLSLGSNLLHHGTFSFIDPRFDQRVFAYRMPGYPLLIAACGASISIIRIVQTIIDTSTVFAVYLIARQLTGTQANTRISLVSAGLVALNPFLIYFSALILSETLFTACLVWSIYLWTINRPFMASMLAAAAVYCRPSAIPVALAMAAFAPLLNLLSLDSYPLLPTLRKVFVSVAIVSGVLLIALLPWAMRNRSVLSEPIWTTTNSGITLYDGFNPIATGSSDQRFLYQIPQLRSMNEQERDLYLNAQARRWAFDHPVASIRLMLWKIARTWSPVPLSAEFGRPLYRWVSAAYAIPLDVAAMVALLLSNMHKRKKFWLLIPAIVFTVIHALSVGSLRYRIPVEPLLAILAGVGVSKLFSTDRPLIET